MNFWKVLRIVLYCLAGVVLLALLLIEPSQQGVSTSSRDNGEAFRNLK